ncbi:hypothetical protein BHE74_00024681 [Ensete ventricosum]|nr:hypothetical protein BHE74_00024681 [Ensete ventricosum]RZS00914.1 hypothetical protein BHM03_00030699 [Ensete ventricosum]
MANSVIYGFHGVMVACGDGFTKFPSGLADGTEIEALQLLPKGRGAVMSTLCLKVAYSPVLLGLGFLPSRHKKERLINLLPLERR